MAGAGAAAWRHLAILDTRDGEYAPVAPIRRRYAYKSGVHTTLSAELMLLMPYRLTSVEWSVVLALAFTHADGQFKVVVVKDLASLVESDVPSTSRALAHLVLIAALLKDAQRHGKSYAYMVNPLIAFRGSAVDHHEAHRAYTRELADPDTVRRRPRSTKPRTAEKGASS